MKINLETYYQLAEFKTSERLEMRGYTVLNFGNKVLMAGTHFDRGEYYWFGAVYEYTTDEHYCDSEIQLKCVSDTLFEDNGHAMEWAMKH
ncbi:Uncharacterised protein [Veillonella ratti]|uniref:Nucleotide modification associated domain-containing protein n=1 Tax=Veillonella ratti TaxID=103892 RepID=A0A6N3BW02_9FIRM